MFEQIFDSEADVFCYLPQQNGRNISACMKLHGSTPSIRVPVLLMRSPLAYFHKSQPLQDCRYSPGF